MNPTVTTHGHFVLSPVSLASRDQDGGPLNLTEKYGTVNSLGGRLFEIQTKKLYMGGVWILSVLESSTHLKSGHVHVNHSLSLGIKEFNLYRI